jgi:hypothetical protein
MLSSAVNSSSLQESMIYFKITEKEFEGLQFIEMIDVWGNGNANYPDLIIHCINASILVLYFMTMYKYYMSKISTNEFPGNMNSI